MGSVIATAAENDDEAMPAAMLRFEDDKVQQLHVRTCVARNVKLKDYTDLTAEQLRKRVAKGDARSMQDLLEVYGLFASEYAYRPVEAKDLPYADFVLDHARRYGKENRQRADRIHNDPQRHDFGQETIHQSAFYRRSGVLAKKRACSASA